MKKTVLAAIAMSSIVALPVIAAASGGLTGDCADCHTMHNSEQGAAVAILGTTDTVTNTPIQNLLRMDCIACHVVDPSGGDNIVDMGNGSQIPQVAHAGATDLAGGNFSYIMNGSSRNGHNVADLADMFGGTGDDDGGTYGAPPGKYRASTHGGVFSTDPSATATSFDLFTCAGSAGCHGTRSQLLSGETIDNGTDNVFSNAVKRTGIAAISGAHHNSYDGAKSGDNYSVTSHSHDGQLVADGYRFIPGLWGYGNEAARWQNVDASSHNEYYGDNDGLSISGCGNCHIEGHSGGLSSRMAFDSVLRVPENSMSGFCATCHGSFHSAGDNNGTISNTGGNGSSGAFLRHPSDYVIPNSSEYAAYTAYEMTAPVARPAVATGASATVTPGTDMVMCLSCHMAHASQYDYMLRFDYTAQQAGDATVGLGVGCLACHTTKGILPENR